MGPGIGFKKLNCECDFLYMKTNISKLSNQQNIKLGFEILFKS